MNPKNLHINKEPPNLIENIKNKTKSNKLYGGCLNYVPTTIMRKEHFFSTL